MTSMKLCDCPVGVPLSIEILLPQVKKQLEEDIIAYLKKNLKNTWYIVVEVKAEIHKWEDS